MDEYAELLEHAIELGAQRRYEEAVGTLLRLISKTDRYAEAYLYLGRSYHALGDYSRAVDVLRHFLSIHPSSAAGYFFTGRSYLSAGRARTAAAYLEKAVEIRPEFISALQLLGYAYLKSKNVERAVEVLAGAVELDPTNQRLLTGYLNTLFVYALRQFRRGNYVYAGELFRYLLENGHEHILVYIHLGMIYRMEGNKEDAEEAYREALRLSPDDELIRFRLAVLMMENGQLQKAFQHLDRITSIPQARNLAQREADRYIAEHFYEERNYTQALHHALEAVKRDPGDIQMRLLAGECYRELEQFEFAANHFQRVLDIDRSHLGAHFGIALVLWQTQKFGEMMNRLRRIDRIDRGNETAYYYRLLCAWKLESEPYELLGHIQEGIRQIGPDTYLFTALGDTYVKLDYHDLAGKWFRKAIQLTPTLPLPYSRLIELHRSGYTVDGVEEIYQNYLELEPKDRRIRGAFVHHLYRAERYREVLDQIALLLPDTDYLQYYNRMRAFCYRKIGDYASASALYWRMLAEEPQKQEFIRALTYCLNKEGKRKTAVSLLGHALDYLSGPSGELYLIYGVLLYREKQYEKALAAFREAAVISPNDWRPHYNIGEIYRRKGMKDFAQRFLQRSERLRAGVEKTEG
jgi:tetratricopeptide (TPR) repeat protein